MGPGRNIAITNNLVTEVFLLGHSAPYNISISKVDYCLPCASSKTWLRQVICNERFALRRPAEWHGFCCRSGLSHAQFRFHSNVRKERRVRGLINLRIAHVPHQDQLYSQRKMAFTR